MIVLQYFIRVHFIISPFEIKWYKNYCSGERYVAHLPLVVHDGDVLKILGIAFALNAYGRTCMDDRPDMLYYLDVK